VWIFDPVADDRHIGIEVVKGVRIILNGGGIEYQDTDLYIRVVAHHNMIETKLIFQCQFWIMTIFRIQSRR
jgi:hypothetical protein